MAKFIIQGGHPISGTFKPAGNKNAALPMLAASLLATKPVTLQNVPLIDDVRVMLDLLDDLGMSIELRGHRVRLDPTGLKPRALSQEACRRIRGSILFAGPLAARFGQATLHAPGGDIIGRRRLDTHMYGLQHLGIRVSLEKNGAEIHLQRGRLRGANLVLDEASVTATENILMAAVLARGQTVIYNAACEPHVQDLCRMLNGMGANITGIGTNRILIEGVEALGGISYRIQPDHIEAGSFLAAAAATGGELTVKDTCCDDLQVIARVFNRLGIRWKNTEQGLYQSARPPFKIKEDLGHAVPKIEDGIWPAFPSDLMSVALVLATRARGSVLFFEKLFESRMYFVDRLIDMGARIVQCDPHRVLVSGPCELYGSRLTSPDIRAGMALVIAALCARGESVIESAEMIDRGYEKLESRLRKLGADIRREK